MSHSNIVLPSFKRYEPSSLVDLKFKSTSHFYSIFTGNLQIESSFLKVIILNFKYVEYTNNLIENLIRTQKNFLKLRSENIINKIGYIVNRETNSLSMLYEHCEGELFNYNIFDTLYSKDEDHCQINKINFLVKLLSIIKKLSMNGIQVGYILSGNLIYNQNSTFVFKVIEPYLFYIINPKDISNRALFGIMTNLEPSPNDFLMGVIFAFKLFLETKENVSIEKLIYLIQKVINTNSSIKSNLGLNDYLMKVSNEYIKNSIYNSIENMKEFISNKRNVVKNVNQPEETIDENRTTHEQRPTQTSSLVSKKIEDKGERREEINQLYNFFVSLLNSHVTVRSCFVCSKKGSSINKICNDILCEDHSKEHSCKNTSIYDLKKREEQVRIYKDDVILINKEEKSKSRISKLGISGKYFNSEVFPALRNVINSLLTLKYKVKLSQEVLNDTFSYHTSHMKKFMKYEFLHVEAMINDYKNNLVEEEKIEAQLNQLSKHVFLCKGFIDEMNNKNTYISPLKNIQSRIEGYEKVISYFKSKIFDALYERIYEDIQDKMMRRFDILHFIFSGKAKVPYLVNLTHSHDDDYSDDDRLLVFYPVEESKEIYYCNMKGYTNRRVADMKEAIKLVEIRKIKVDNEEYRQCVVYEDSFRDINQLEGKGDTDDTVKIKKTNEEDLEKNENNQRRSCIRLFKKDEIDETGMKNILLNEKSIDMAKNVNLIDFHKESNDIDKEILARKVNKSFMNKNPYEELKVNEDNQNRTTLLISSHNRVFNEKNINNKNNLKTMSVDNQKNNQFFFLKNSKFSIFLKNFLFVSGGEEEIDEEKNKLNKKEVEKNTVKHLFLLDLNGKQIYKMNNSNHSHSNHSMTVYKNQYIIIVSGSLSYKSEIFDILSNRWIDLPDIDDYIENAVLYIHNEFLYILGGKCKSRFDHKFNTIQIPFLNMKSPVRWESAEFRMVNNHIKSGMTVESVNLIDYENMGLIEIEEGKVCLVGGYKEITDNKNNTSKLYSKKVVLVDFCNMIISLQPNGVDEKMCFQSGIVFKRLAKGEVEKEKEYGGNNLNGNGRFDSKKREVKDEEKDEKKRVYNVFGGIGINEKEEVKVVFYEMLNK